jgi:hypothetical protein
VTDLVEFLKARLDEDERTALAAAAANPGVAARHWSAEEVDDKDPTTGLWRKAWGIVPSRVRGIVLARTIDITPTVSAHIARHDPSRVLRDVEAKRAELALAAALLQPPPMPPGLPALAVEMAAIKHDDERALGEVWLQLLALPYSDHESYRQEWAP